MSRADEFFSDAPSPDDAPPRKKATQMSTDLIKRLRDALQQAVNCLSLEVILQGRDPDLAEWNAAIAEADAHLKNGGWVRVEDALPVVPEGVNIISVYAYKKCVYSMNWYTDSTGFAPGVTHWRYDPTPQPPEQIK